MIAPRGLHSSVSLVILQNTVQSRDRKSHRPTIFVFFRSFIPGLDFQKFDDDTITYDKLRGRVIGQNLEHYQVSKQNDVLQFTFNAKHRMFTLQIVSLVMKLQCSYCILGSSESERYFRTMARRFCWRQTYRIKSLIFLLHLWNAISKSIVKHFLWLISTKKVQVTRYPNLMVLLNVNLLDATTYVIEIGAFVNEKGINRWTFKIKNKSMHRIVSFSKWYLYPQINYVVLLDSTCNNVP